MSISADTEIKDLIESAFGNEAACELDHSEDSPIHEGPAEWYLAAKCPKCGHANTSLICNKYRNTIIDRIETGHTHCQKCYKRSPVKAAIVSLAKKS